MFFNFPRIICVIFKRHSNSNAEFITFFKDNSLPTIIFIGRLTKIKRLPILIEAFAKFVKLNPNFKLLIIGDGEERDNIINIIYRLKIEKNVILEGLSSQKEIVDKLNQSKFFVMSSISEGFPKVIAEAATIAREHGTKLGVITFEPHPRSFFENSGQAFRLTPFRAKIEAIESLGVDKQQIQQTQLTLQLQLVQHFWTSQEVLEVFTCSVLLERMSNCPLERWAFARLRFEQ